MTAAVLGFDDVFFLSGCIAVVGVLMSIILRKPKLSANDSSSEEGQKADAAMMMGH